VSNSDQTTLKSTEIWVEPYHQLYARSRVSEATKGELRKLIEQSIEGHPDHIMWKYASYRDVSSFDDIHYWTATLCNLKKETNG
jgi:hypothetical protein